MKQIIIIFAISSLILGFDLTFTKAYNEFRKGTSLVRNAPKLAQKHFKKAYLLLNKINNKNSAQIHYMLGRMYCNGWGVEKNYEKAKQHMLEAINLGNERSYCCLARLYLRTGDLQKARKYLDLALSIKKISYYCNDIKSQIKGE